MDGHVQLSKPRKLPLVISLLLYQHSVMSIPQLTLGGAPMDFIIMLQVLVQPLQLTQSNLFLISKTKDKSWLWLVAHNSEQDADILLPLVLPLPPQLQTLMLL